MVATEINGAICWRSGLAIDADGAPRAYGPPGKPALDFLDNAGSAQTGWYGVVVDGDGNPVEQGPDDPAPGFYVSPTALCDPSRRPEDPRRYVDSSAVPYVSIPRELRAQGVRLGDLAWVCYRAGTPGERHCEAIVADVGPRGRYGEGSIALAEALGIPSSPKRGGVDSGVAFAIFRGSAADPPWPRDPQDIRDRARELLAAWGADNLARI